MRKKNIINFTTITMCFCFFLLNNTVYGQSRKKQIIALNQSLDSAKVVIDSLNESYAQNLNVLTNTLEVNNRRILDLETQLADTKMELSESETNLRRVKDELTSSLEELTTLKNKKDYSTRTEMITFVEQYSNFKKVRRKKSNIDDLPYKNTETIKYVSLYENGKTVVKKVSSGVDPFTDYVDEYGYSLTNAVYSIKKDKQGKTLMAYTYYVTDDSFSRYKYYFDENGKTYAISYFYHDYFGSHGCGEKFERTKIEFYNQNFEIIGVENSIKMEESKYNNGGCDLSDDFFTKDLNSSIKNLNTFLKQHDIVD